LAKILCLALGLIAGPDTRAIARANPLCDHADMARDYTPPEDVTRTVTRLERNTEAGRKLKQELHDLAVREMQAGATVGQLAKYLPWSAETLRGIARKAGIPLKREPTVVGKKALQEAVEAARAERPTAPTQPRPAPRPAPRKATPRRPLAAEPEYGGVELIVAQSCADLAYKRASPEQILRLERVKTAAKDGEEDYAVADAAYEMGLVKDADIAAARKG